MRIGSLSPAAVLFPAALAVALGAGCDVGLGAGPATLGVPHLDGGAAGGIPCDIDAILINNCHSCHGAVPSGSASMSLVTLADLSKPSYADPTMSFAQRSVLRMQGTPSAMPPKPAGAVSAADQATFAAWVTSNLPTGTCEVPGDGGTGPSDPLNAPATCTSNSPNRSNEGGNMAPGQACNACHTANRKRTFAIAGTLFATGHEPDDCNGATGAAADVAGAQVIITDKNGNETPIAISTPSGNFTLSGALALPYTARVVYNGKTRTMVTPQTSGDCNGCHTQDGSSTNSAPNAPGRITLPF